MFWRRLLKVGWLGSAESYSSLNTIALGSLIRSKYEIFHIHGASWRSWNARIGSYCVFCRVETRIAGCSGAGCKFQRSFFHLFVVLISLWKIAQRYFIIKILWSIVWDCAEKFTDTSFAWHELWIDKFSIHFSYTFVKSNSAILLCEIIEEIIYLIIRFCGAPSVPGDRQPIIPTVW